MGFDVAPLPNRPGSAAAAGSRYGGPGSRASVVRRDEFQRSLPGGALPEAGGLTDLVERLNIKSRGVSGLVAVETDAFQRERLFVTDHLGRRYELVEPRDTVEALKVSLREGTGLAMTVKGDYAQGQIRVDEVNVNPT